MRPLRLEFQAFGSYPGRHVIDFEALGKRGLFVVAGPTGTGKTTVFDAMVYALYGVLPGGRAADGEARSHHAEPMVETFAQLDFEVEGVRYRVRRTPKWERPKHRGDGTTEQPPTGILSALGEGTSTAIATQVTRVTEECVALVGLEARHFQRVVLLPQGKFTEFLIAGDESREQLLRQLFGGELYERATKLLKQRADDLDEKVAQVDEEVRHHRTNALAAWQQVRAAWVDEPGPDDERTDEQLLADILQLEPVAVARREALAAIEQQALAATETRTRAEAEARRFADAQTHRRVLAQLAATAEQVVADEAAVVASRRARPVVAAAAKVATAATAAGLAGEALERLRTMVADGFADLGRPSPAFDAASVVGAVQQVAHELGERSALLTAHRTARRAADDARVRADRSAATHAALVQRVEQLHLQAQAAAEAVAQVAPGAGMALPRQMQLTEASKCVATRRQLDQAERRAEEAEASARHLHDVYHRVMEQFIAATAPRLAATLADGDACPVCGSAEHPHLASADGTAAVHVDDVDRARGDESAAVATAASHRSVAAALRESLGPAAERTLDELLAAEVVAAEALKDAQRADAELRQAQAAELAAQAQLADAVASEVEAGKVLAALSAQVDVTEVEAQRLADLVVDIDADVLQAQSATLATLQAATRDAGATFEAATIRATALRSAEVALREALADSGVHSVDDATDALLEPASESARERAAAEWHRRRAESTAVLAQLEAQGVPDAPPDLHSVRDVAARLDAEAKLAAQRFTTAADALHRARADITAALEVADGSADLRRQRDTARIVFRTCNGEAGMRVKLERWVLAAELDRVTESANQHLARLTDHRYRLARMTGIKGGLGLEVFDAHTGRSRATASLSGGEQFQASLALALGLADVVSRGGSGSGKQFEALFVDEGFGSLDPDSLDDAIVALQQLQAAGRMVGAITHVEAMQQHLHVGIEVAALPDGRGSTLTVHP